MVINPQNIPKEKRPILYDRATDISSVIVVDAVGLWRDRRVLKVGNCCQRADPVNFIGGAVKFVGSGLEYHVGHRAVRAPQLRVVTARGHINRLNGFNRRNVNL